MSNFIIVQVTLLVAAAAAHIACDLGVLYLLPIKTKEAIPLHERGLVNAPGALEAAKEVDYVARAHIEGRRSVIWFDSGPSGHDPHAF